MKKKEANFQFVKIIAMLMIISHHIVSKNAFNIDTEVVGIMVNKIALQVMGNNAFIGNNLFFLVSAWFLSSKKEEAVNTQYSLSSCLRIEKTVLFYSYAMCVIMLIFMGGGKQEHPLKVYISGNNGNVVVSNHVHDFPHDMAVLSSGAS